MKQKVFLAVILLIILFSQCIYAAGYPFDWPGIRPQYEFFVDHGDEIGRKLAFNPYGMNSSMWIHTDKMSNAQDFDIMFSAFYKPLWEIPFPIHSEPHPPIEVEYDVFVLLPKSLIPKLTNVLTAQVGETVAAEGAHTSAGYVEITLYTKRNGKWEKIKTQKTSSDEYGTVTDAICEYVISDTDKRLMFVTKYALYDARDEKYHTNSSAFLVDVGQSGFHISLYESGFIFVGAFIVFFILLLIYEKRTDKKAQEINQD